MDDCASFRTEIKWKRRQPVFSCTPVDTVLADGEQFDLLLPIALLDRFESSNTSLENGQALRVVDRLRSSGLPWTWVGLRIVGQVLKQLQSSECGIQQY